MLSASPTTWGGGRAREEMIIAGATDGSVGLRDHMANSFLPFSADEVAVRFITSREVVMGDAPSNDGVEGTPGSWRTDSGGDIDFDIGSDVGSDVGSGACSEAGSATGSRAGSCPGSEVGSWTGSEMCRKS